MQNKKINYRHGDVLLIPVAKSEGEKQNHLTLAEGEVTGHSHRITKGDATLFKFDEKFYLKVQSEIAVLDHEEHGKMELLRGDYEIIIQQDYEPTGWKNVID